MIRAATGGRDRLEHEREAARLLERERVVVERERRRGGAALRPEAAELRRRLRRQPDVADDADVRLGDRPQPATAIRPAPSSLTQVGAALLDHPDRARDRLLVGDLVADPNGRSPITSGRRAARVTARVRKIISSRVTGSVESWPSMTIAAVSPTSTSSTPASSASTRRGRVVGGHHRDLVAARASSRASSGSASLPGAGRRGCRAGADGCSFASPPSSRTLSIRRVAPTRAATASVGPSRSATAT